MNINIWLGGIVTILSGVLFYVILRHRRSNTAPRIDAVTIEASSEITTEPQEYNDSVKLILGPSPNHPVVSITALPANVLFDGSRKIEPDRSNLGQLSALLQAVPSVLAAGELAQGKYMKVVIDGTLAAAKNGDGLRAWTLNSNGQIAQHAKLFDTTRISNLVNAAALFQVASVIVAQKHLADISKKLDDIKQGVNRIQAFQQDERKSVITGALRYFDQVAYAVLQGEMSSSVRQKLST